VKRWISDQEGIHVSFLGGWGPDLLDSKDTLVDSDDIEIVELEGCLVVYTEKKMFRSLLSVLSSVFGG
jgi:hypothetical protein